MSAFLFCIFPILCVLCFYIILYCILFLLFVHRCLFPVSLPLPRGGNPVAVNKYHIISYHIIYLISYLIMSCIISYHIKYHIIYDVN